MEKEFMNVKEIREYLPDFPSVNTIYSWVHHKKIPYTKFGKKLFFQKAVIDEWNASNRPGNDMLLK